MLLLQRGDPSPAPGGRGKSVPQAPQGCWDPLSSPEQVVTEQGR